MLNDITSKPALLVQPFIIHNFYLDYLYFFLRALFLQDVSACTSCKQSDLFKLMEFDLPAGMIVFGMSLLFIMSFTQGWRKHSRNSET